MTTFEQQLRSVVDFFTRCSTETVNKVELTETISASVKKLKMLEEYTISEKFSKDLVMIEDSVKLLANDIAEAKMLLSEVI